MIKQGYPKKQFLLKQRIIAKQTDRLLNSDPWQLPVPRNAYYGTKELQYYFSTLTLGSMSGEHAKRHYWKYYGLNLPDQQTVRVRVEKLSCDEIQSNNNRFGLTNQTLTGLKYPKYQNRMVNKMVNKMLKQVKEGEQNRQNRQNSPNKQKRRQLRKKRKLQRERGVVPPVGNYLALDEHNDPYYGVVDFLLSNGENMASYLVKERQKQSTKVFYQYLTVYSFERGIRQVLGFHLMRRNKQGDEWHREAFGPIIKQLMDQIMEVYSIAGVVGDGRYYNGGGDCMADRVSVGFCYTGRL